MMIVEDLITKVIQICKTQYNPFLMFDFNVQSNSWSRSMVVTEEVQETGVKWADAKLRVHKYERAELETSECMQPFTVQFMYM